MEILFSTLTGGSFPLVVEATAVVGAVKQSIHQLRGIAPDAQRLILGSRLLSDSRSLASYDVEAGTKLTLIAIPRPQALLEVEVWPERAVCGDSSSFDPLAALCAYPATIVRACVSGATQDEANGVYCPVAPGDRLVHGIYTLRWAEQSGERPAGWYVFEEAQGHTPSIRAEVQATVRCLDDMALDGTYLPAENGVFEFQSGAFKLEWNDDGDAIDRFSGMYLSVGWHVRGLVGSSCDVDVAYDFEQYSAWWELPFFQNACES